MVERARAAQVDARAARPHAKVLIIEDESSLAAALAYTLRREDYEVVLAEDGAAGLALARSEQPDLILLDVMLPKMDGFEVCRRVRQTSAVPILMVTARTDEIDRVVGLEIGADDYITKPFSMRELVARIKAMLRRRDLLRDELATSGQPEGERIISNDLEMDIPAHRVTLAGMPVALKPKEFDLLAFLVRHKGQVFSAEQLLERVWGYEYLGDTRTVPVHIRGLREKIEQDPSAPQRIETVRGVGYRFNG